MIQFRQIPFHESISRNRGSLVPALTGLTLAVLGVILLTSPHPGPVR